MNKNIKLMYEQILKNVWKAKVVRTENNVYGIEITKDMPGEFYSGTRPYKQRRFFYLYPRNPYSGEFCDE